jgi:hypothetical protein
LGNESLPAPSAGSKPFLIDGYFGSVAKKKKKSQGKSQQSISDGNWKNGQTFLSATGETEGDLEKGVSLLTLSSPHSQATGVGV